MLVLIGSSQMQERAGNIIGEKNADSGARLQAVMNLMVKTANTSTEGQVVPANQAEAHKQMNAGTSF